MPNFYSFDELQAMAHNAAREFIKKDEPLMAAVLYNASSILAREDNQEAKFSVTKAVLEWKKAIEQAKGWCEDELKDTNPETLSDDTFTP